jgi:hypothetical protein
LLAISDYNPATPDSKNTSSSLLIKRQHEALKCFMTAKETYPSFVDAWRNEG